MIARRLIFSLVLLMGPPASALTDGKSQEVSDAPTVLIERDFVQGPFGQVHVRIARPTLEPAKTPLVLFHPTPYSSDYFSPYMKLMAADRIVIAMDTPGYGDSDPPDAPLTIAEYADSAAVALQALGYGEEERAVDILGYHTGVLIASELAIMHPHLVRRLVLPGVPFFTGEARERAYKENVKPDPISSDGSHLKPKWEFANYAASVGLSLERAQQHFNDQMQCYPNCWWAYEGVFTYESEKRFPDVTQPALLISYDGSLETETKAAVDYFQNASHVHIDGVTKGAFDVAADKLAVETRRFLDK